MLVDGSGDEFSSGATFTDKQHIDILQGDAADLFADRLHRGSAADQPIGTGIRFRRTVDCRGGIHLSANLSRLFNGCREHVEVERFDKIVKCPDLHGLDGCIGSSMTGDEDHEQTRIQASQFGVQIDSGLSPEANVEECNLWRFTLHELQRL